MALKTSAAYMYCATDTWHRTAYLITSLCREAIGHRWILLKSAKMLRFWVVYTVSLSKLLNKQSSCLLILDTMTLMWRQLKTFIYYGHNLCDKSWHCHFSISLIMSWWWTKIWHMWIILLPKMLFQRNKQMRKSKYTHLFYGKNMWSNETISVQTFQFPTLKLTATKERKKNRYNAFWCFTYKHVCVVSKYSTAIKLIQHN